MIYTRRIRASALIGVCLVAVQCGGDSRSLTEEKAVDTKDLEALARQHGGFIEQETPPEQDRDTSSNERELVDESEPAGYLTLYRDPGGFEGATAVLVSTELSDDESAREVAGLTHETLQTTTELRLRRNGIRVVSPNDIERQQSIVDLNARVDEWTRLVGPGRVLELTVSVSELQTTAGVIYTAEVSVNQQALVGDLSEALRGLTYTTDYFEHVQFVQALTWRSGFFGIAPPGAVRTKVVESLEQSLDDFSNEYLAVNPR